MSDPGTLAATREGPHIRLDMTCPVDYDFAFSVERLDGDDVDGNAVWTPIHTGTNKFVQGETDYELATDLPLPGPRTYRALAYRNAEPDANVLILHTDGVYTDPVTVT